MLNSLANFSHDSIEDFNESYSLDENKHLKILQWNVRGINNIGKFDEILQTLESSKTYVDLIVLGETWLKTDYCPLYEVPNYKSFFSCREESNGGLAVFVNKSYSSKLIKNNCTDGFHHIQIELITKGHFYHIHAVYRPPNYDYGKFSEYLENVFCSTPSNYSCIIVGDINIPVNNTLHNISNRYLRLLESYSYICSNTVPTRPLSNNVLDHVLCKVDDSCCLRNDTIFHDLSDHLPIISSFKLPIDKEKITLCKRIVDHQKLNSDFDLFINNIGQVADVGNSLQLITSTYNSLLEQNTRIIEKTITVKGNSCPWMTLDLWTICRIKNNYLKRVKRNPTNQHLKEMLKYVSQKVDDTKAKCKKSYYEKLLNVTNHTKLWRNIRLVFGLSKKNHGICLMNNGSRTNNDAEVCEVFNNFFSNIGSQLAGNIQNNLNSDPLTNLNRIDRTIVLWPSNENEVMTLIKSLDSKKSCGPDNFPASVLKRNVGIFSQILCQYFNLMLLTGEYPDYLKIAKVIPVFKAGDPEDCNNYRPISTLSVFNKIFEKLLVNRLVKFLTKHEILYKFQYGFRQGSSTQTAILELVDDIIKEVDSKKSVGALFLDLKKAFDTLDHRILLKKLEMYGIRGVAHDIIKSYLSNRKQYVAINGERSSYQSIGVGVPQGSNIGPLLFLLYINDLGKLQLNGTPRLFADDTALFYPNKNVNIIINSIEADLGVLKNFFDANLLSLNISKTKYMIFHSIRKVITDHVHPRLGHQVVEEVNCFKYLGIKLDPTLSWIHQINHVEKKLAPLCGMLWRVSTFVPRHVLLKFYFAYIHSQLNYLVSVWGYASSSSLNKIRTLQNRCLKTIFKKPLLYSTLQLYSDSSHNILPLNYLRDYQTLLFVHNLQNNPNMHHNITLSSAPHSHLTRQNDHLRSELASTNLGQRRITFIGPTKYNTLPFDLKQITSLPIFKVRLKQFLKHTLHELFR